MKKLIIFAAIAVLTAALCVSCKQKNKDIELLQNFVEEINSQPGKDLANPDNIYQNNLFNFDYWTPENPDARYRQLGYYTQALGYTFSPYAADSVKSALSKKLTEPGMQKLVKILSRNSIGLQYVYEMEGNEMTVVFTPSELSTQQNQ